MKYRHLSLACAVLSVALPSLSSTYFGGFEASIRGDNDYNDLVFRIRGAHLTLETGDGAWFGNPVLGVSGTPFWNNSSDDGLQANIGYCIYGGGSCNAGMALDAGALYLANAKNPSKPANLVLFSVAGESNPTVWVTIESGHGVLGFVDGSYGAAINPGGGSGTYAFHPHSDFYLIAWAGSASELFSSLDLNSCEPSHFAFFATPEPGTLWMMGSGLVVVGLLCRRRSKKTFRKKER